MDGINPDRKELPDDQTLDALKPKKGLISLCAREKVTVSVKLDSGKIVPIEAETTDKIS